MEMIIISTPSEFIVLPPHPLTKDTQQTFILKLGYMRSSQSYIHKLDSLRDRIKQEDFYVVLEIQDSYFLSLLKKVDIYPDVYYKEKKPRWASLYCVSPNKTEYDKMRFTIMGNCPINTPFSNETAGYFYEVWNFKATILKRMKDEDLEEIRDLGVSILTLLGRK